MKNVFYKFLTSRVLFAFFSLVFLTFVSVNAQDTEDRIVNTVPKIIPLKIEILNADTDDFFNDVRIKVTNTGDKPIYSLRFVLLVPNSKSPIGESAIFLRYGRKELWFDKVETPTEKDPSIQPDKSYTFKIDKQTAKTYTRLFSEGSLTSTINSRLEFTELRYGDQTGYTRRGYFEKKTLNFLLDLDKENSIFRTSRSNECSILTNKTISTNLFNLNFLRSSEVVKSLQISPQISSGWCPNGNGCAYDGCEKTDPYEVGGCPEDPNVPDKDEEYLYADWYEWGPECTSDPAYECKYVRIRQVTCWDDSSIWVADIEECDGTPPEEPCEPTGHGEGETGFEFECSDEVDNDCDGKVDCQETRCSFRQDCIEQCDADRDGVRDRPCGGPDCYPADPNLPVRGSGPGQFVETICNDGRDDDCQQDGIDCYDSDCNTNPQSGCPPSEPENCYDLIDNDYDYKIDCQDEECCAIRQDCATSNPQVCPPPPETNCSDYQDNDGDGNADCDDDDCCAIRLDCGIVNPNVCQPPEPSPDPNETPDPCQGDECCGRGTHTECTPGECEPDIEICEYITNPYTGLPTPVNCVTYPGACEPETCFEVCN